MHLGERAPRNPSLDRRTILGDEVFQVVCAEFEDLPVLEEGHQTLTFDQSPVFGNPIAVLIDPVVCRQLIHRHTGVEGGLTYRSEERRVGKECVSTGSSWVVP